MENLFIHRFYKEDSGFSIAVFKIIKIRKKSLYVVECFDIISKDKEHKHQDLEKCYQYYIGDIYLLRKHKKRLNSLDKTLYFYDPRRDDSEKITVEDYNKIKYVGSKR